MCVTDHKYESVDEGFPTELHFEFYHQSRKDNLLRLEKSATKMVETFKDRQDFLYCRETDFDDSNTVAAVKEMYHRNPLKSVDEDPSTINYDLRKNMVIFPPATH